jgi:hypothetical protein
MLDSYDCNKISMFNGFDCKNFQMFNWFEGKNFWVCLFDFITKLDNWWVNNQSYNKIEVLSILDKRISIFLYP